MWLIILGLEILFWIWLFFIPNVWLGIAIVYFLFLLILSIRKVTPNTILTKEVFGKYTWVLRQ